MDAKPQRPVRSIRVKNDENLPPVLQMNKTIHQRNKSSPALSTMLGAGALKAPAKRTAFGDVSNTFNANRPSKDDSAITKQGLQGLAKITQPLQERKSTAFLRQAQRPLSVSGLKGLLTGSTNVAPAEATIKVASTEVSSLNQTANTRKVLTKRNTTIFRDGSLDTVQESENVTEAPAPSVELLDSRDNSACGAEKIPDSEPQIVLPPPTLIPLATGDPVKEHFNLNSDCSLPGISEVTLNAPTVSSEPNDQDIVKADQVRDQTNVISNLLSFIPDSVDTMPRDAGFQTMHPSLPPIRKVEPYQPPTSTSGITTQTMPSILPQFLQPPQSEPEENWDDEEDEAYDEEGYVTARSYRSKGDNTTGGVTTVLFPQMNQKARREINSAKDYVEATRSVEEVEDESYDTSMVAEYGDEIFDYMKQLEVKMLPNAHYMDNQHEIQWSMRSVLTDWLVQVHHRFNLLPETLFLTVNYIDRFLSCKVVSLGKLQLVGATAIFIAAKYEEINCPSVQEIVYMVDGGYTVDEILKAERFMLTMLQFELGWPGPMSFLRRISKADDYDLETRTLAKYFLEVTVMDERFIGSPPSFTAAASHCLARLMLHKGLWSQHHVYYSNYTFTQLRPLLSLLVECCDDPRKHHAAVYNKYCDKRYKRASAFVESELQRGFLLPGTPVIKEAPRQQFFHYYDNSYLRM